MKSVMSACWSTPQLVVHASPKLVHSFILPAYKAQDKIFLPVRAFLKTTPLVFDLDQSNRPSRMFSKETELKKEP